LPNVLGNFLVVELFGSYGSFGSSGKFWEVFAGLGFYRFHFLDYSIYLVAESFTVLIGFTP
jgi:hypothetical protein